MLKINNAKIIFLLLVMFSPFGVFAKGIVKISGQIIKPLSDSIEISYNDNNLAYYPKQFGARLDKQGKFTLSFPIPDGEYTNAQITHGNRLTDVLLSAGDSLVMTVNAQHFDSTVRYKGRGANVQNFIAAHIIKVGRMGQYPSVVKAQLQNTATDFLKALDKNYADEVALLNKSAMPLPTSFITYWKAFYRYYNYFFIQQYPQTSQIIKLRRYTDTIPAENYEVVKHMPLLYNDSFLQAPPYLLYLTGAIEIKLKADGYAWMGKDSLKMVQFEDSVYKLAYQTMPDKSLEYYIAQNIYGRAKAQRLGRTESQFTVFKQHWPNSSYTDMLEKQVAIARRLAPGQPAPDFDIRTADGGHMKLSDLKGKVVYLGFWAGWCRPCIGDMINEKMVKDLIRKKPLQFVYASIGTDTAGERAIVERYKIEGLYTNFAGMWDAPELKAYGVQSIPAYYLIDEDGNFAVQRAPLPGQTNDMVREIGKLFK